MVQRCGPVIRRQRPVVPLLGVLGMVWWFPEGYPGRRAPRQLEARRVCRRVLSRNPPRKLGLTGQLPAGPTACDQVGA
jgi:hypothetical protein